MALLPRRDLLEELAGLRGVEGEGLHDYIASIIAGELDARTGAWLQKGGT